MWFRASCRQIIPPRPKNRMQKKGQLMFTRLVQSEMLKWLAGFSMAFPTLLTDIWRFRCLFSIVHSTCIILKFTFWKKSMPLYSEERRTVSTDESSVVSPLSFKFQPQSIEHTDVIRQAASFSFFLVVEWIKMYQLTEKNTAKMI